MLSRYPSVVVPDHPVRLSSSQYVTLREAVLSFECDMYERGITRAERLLATSVRRALPTHAPYDILISEHHWPIVSQALRPVAKPKQGSFEAKARALYAYLIKRGYGRVPVLRVPRAP